MAASGGVQGQWGLGAIGTADACACCCCCVGASLPQLASTTPLNDDVGDCEDGVDDSLLLGTSGVVEVELRDEPPPRPSSLLVVLQGEPGSVMSLAVLLPPELLKPLLLLLLLLQSPHETATPL